jgi:cyclic beta-1,2-glucan synthetase
MPSLDPGQGDDLAVYRDAGAQLAASLPVAVPESKRRSRPASRNRRLRKTVAEAAEVPPGDPKFEYAKWLLENARLVYASEQESREFILDPHLPVVADSSGARTFRVSLVARGYLRCASNTYRDDGLLAFLEGFQRSAVLDMAEIWALRPAIQLELVDCLTGSPSDVWPVAITSLRLLAETSWKDLFELVSVTNKILDGDPAGAYPRMDFESRENYRTVIGDLAKHNGSPESADKNSQRLTEHQIASTAIDLAKQAAAVSDGSRAAARRSHVGFYLIDKGLDQLERAVDYRPPLKSRLTRLVLRYPTPYYLAAIELLTLFIVFEILNKLSPLYAAFTGLLLLLLPATQAAADFVNNLTAFLVRPRVLPKLDLSTGIPDDCLTLVAIPTLLLKEAQVRDLALDLEIRFLANRDPNLYFALVTDWPDSNHPFEQGDPVLDLCQQLIEGLNRRYQLDGRSPFFLLHRHRVYNESEGTWMGWERKRGKLLDLNQYLRGDYDAFPVKIGDVSVLPRVRYIITLDSDTQLPRDSAARLIGTISHPLNQAVVEPVSRMVVEGYGILQPRIGISIQSAARSRLAALFSGQTGFDIYTRAVSDVYQDLFGEGIYTGKGIYEVDALREAIEDRFPDNALLSHDLIEGAYARAALVTDIELIDDYPSHFSAFSRRKHRWVRGDWQIMRWTRGQVPDRYGRLIVNPISLISQWKILDNLRRSLLEPAMLLLLLGSWFFLPGFADYWTLAAVGMLFIPAYSGLLFSLLRVPTSARNVPAWARSTASAFLDGNAMALFSLIFLLHQALLSMDAVTRSVRRLLFTRRNLLEWETAAEAETAGRPKAPVDVYLEWSPWIAVVIGIAVRLLHPSAFLAAAPVLILWIGSRGLATWLNKPLRAPHSKLGKEDTRLLQDSADRIWRFFHDWSSATTNWMIPDHVREDGKPELRLSPTNLGMLLNARIAAVHMGLAPLSEFVFETRQTLDRVLALPKYRGHLYNWYDISTMKEIPPFFISSVDSGNLAGCLWTLKQAALAFANEPAVKRGVTKAQAAELRDLADVCDRLVRDMDFSFLYQPRKKALSVGYDVRAGRLEPGCYDLLASEARMASFVAIAKGDIPQESWFRLGRAYTLVRGERILLSWTGTMFEYLMPALWMKHYPDTIADQSMKAVVRVQRDYARRKGVPWGISESACLGEPRGDHCYGPFGIPDLAIKTMDKSTLVISPYSSFLATASDPAAAVRNLREMEEFGWIGRYGFFESIDYRSAGGEVIHIWMAHHQGMSLLATANLLFGNPLQKYFHAEPHVLATELLLHERVPDAPITMPERDLVPRVATTTKFA